MFDHYHQIEVRLVRLEAKVDHIHELLHEVAHVMSDPHALASMTARLKTSAASLEAAIHKDHCHVESHSRGSGGPG